MPRGIPNKRRADGVKVSDTLGGYKKPSTNDTLQRAANELRYLQQRIQVLNAQMEVFNKMISILPTQRGYGNEIAMQHDSAFDLEQLIKK